MIACRRANHPLDRVTGVSSGMSHLTACYQAFGHSSRVFDVRFCPADSSVFASCSDDCTARIWQLDQSTGRIQQVWQGPQVLWHGPACGLACMHARSDHSLIPCSLQLACCVGHTSEVLRVTWSPDGRLLATGAPDPLRSDALPAPTFPFPAPCRALLHHGASTHMQSTPHPARLGGRHRAHLAAAAALPGLFLFLLVFIRPLANRSPRRPPRGSLPLRVPPQRLFIKLW